MVVSPTHQSPLPPPGNIPGTHSCYWFDPRAIVRPEFQCHNRESNPATFRLVVQCLNRLRSRVPPDLTGTYLKYLVLSAKLDNFEEFPPRGYMHTTEINLSALVCLTQTGRQTEGYTHRGNECGYFPSSLALCWNEKSVSRGPDVLPSHSKVCFFGSLPQHRAHRRLLRAGVQQNLNTLCVNKLTMGTAPLMCV
jgi:hypothetical protein